MTPPTDGAMDAPVHYRRRRALTSAGSSGKKSGPSINTVIAIAVSITTIMQATGMITMYNQFIIDHEQVSQQRKLLDKLAESQEETKNMLTGLTVKVNVMYEERNKK